MFVADVLIYANETKCKQDVTKILLDKRGSVVSRAWYGILAARGLWQYNLFFTISLISVVRNFENKLENALEK